MPVKSSASPPSSATVQVPVSPSTASDGPVSETTKARSSTGSVAALVRRSSKPALSVNDTATRTRRPTWAGVSSKSEPVASGMSV